MADLRESFPVLEDSSTQEGAALHKVLEGDAIASKNASASLVAKDASDNFKYLKINAAGELLVNTEGADLTCVYIRGTATGSATFVDVASTSLTTSTDYVKLSWVCSCFRDAIFEILWIDDDGGSPTEHILADVLCGPGDFTDSGDVCVDFTTGSTGTQTFKVRAKNLNATSDFRATISVQEIV